MSWGKYRILNIVLYLCRSSKEKEETFGITIYYCQSPRQNSHYLRKKSAYKIPLEELARTIYDDYNIHSCDVMSLIHPFMVGPPR